jgi:hypothetical protein
MLYALLGTLVIVVVLAASALSLFLQPGAGAPPDSSSRYPDAGGTSP